MSLHTQLLFNNQYIFLHSALLLKIGKRHFARFCNCQDPHGFRNLGVACEILYSDNQGSEQTFTIQRFESFVQIYVPYCPVQPPMSLQISSFSSIINTFSALHVAFEDWKAPFCKISQSPRPHGFRNLGVACEILHSDNRGSEHRGCTVHT